jgi:predicted transcriptional regulator
LMMNIVELKLKIIAKIVATDDIALLNKIQEIINDYEYNLSVNEPSSTYEKVASEKFFVLNEWQQKRIDIALKQVENGEYISDEEAEKEMQIWYKEEEKRLSGQ